jgi:two-component system cell cycle sensor histidine kinase/response regulator CckA
MGHRQAKRIFPTPYYVSMIKTSRTILVVEDEIRMLNILERSLSKYGYTVLLASDGEAAMNVYLRQKEKIDVVLLDIELPKIDGWNLLSKMKAANPDVKVVFTSGFLDAQLEWRLLNAGAKRAIQKPYQIEEMVSTLQEVIDS